MTTPHTPPDILDGLSETLLTRYVTGVATARETHTVQEWASTDSARQAALDNLRQAWRASEASETPVWPTEQSWMRLKQTVQGSPAAGPVPLARPARSWSIAFGGVLLGAIALVALGRLTATSHAPSGTVYQTVSGARSTFTLTDGTQITLGPASRIQLASDYGNGTRNVMLEGEAYFAVIHDTRHPFAVLTHNLQVNDVGTEFDVRAYPEDHEMRVAVARGAVAVVGAGRGNGAKGHSERSFDLGTVSRTRPSPQNTPTIFQEIPLSAGDMIDVINGTPTVIHHANIPSLTAWMQGRLVFDGTPLREVVSDLERAFGLKVVIADSTLAAQRITAAFGTEPVSEVLDVVTQAVGARYEWAGRTIVIRKAETAVHPSETHAPRVPLATAQAMGHE